MRLLLLCLSLVLSFSTAAQVSSALDDSIASTHNDVEKELSLFAQAQGYTIAQNATVVDSNQFGFAAIALFQEETFNIDLSNGTDIGAVYYSPGEGGSSALAGGFYLAQIRYSESGSTEIAFVDDSGNSAHVTAVDFTLKPVAPLAPVETAEYSVRVNQNGTGLLAPAVSLHGHCWVVDVGHGSCWIVPVE